MRLHSHLLPCLHNCLHEMTLKRRYEYNTAPLILQITCSVGPALSRLVDITTLQLLEGTLMDTCQTTFRHLPHVSSWYQYVPQYGALPYPAEVYTLPQMGPPPYCCLQLAFRAVL